MLKSKFFIIALILFMTISASRILPSTLESFLVVSDPLSKSDAIVVMAGARDIRLPPVPTLYKDGLASKVLLTNDGIFASWSQKYQRNLYLVEWAREDLLEMGVPEDAIVLLNYTASGTIHDVLNTLHYVRAHPEIRILLVVTSDYHTRRTLWTFRRVFEGEGVRIGVCPVAEYSHSWWRRASALYLEFFKYAYYRVRY